MHIINGEIVADDDPRVKAKFQQQSSAGPARRHVGGIASLNGGGGGAPQGSASQGAPAPGQAGPAAAGSPLQALARQLGVEGTVVIPPVWKIPELRIEKIHLLVAALLVFVFGWRALVFLGFALLLTRQ